MKKIILSIFLIVSILQCFHCATSNQRKIYVTYNHIASRIYDLETRGFDIEDLDRELDRCRVLLQSKKFSEAEKSLALLIEPLNEKYHRLLDQKYVYENVIFQDVFVNISWGKKVGFIAHPIQQGKYPGLIFLRGAASTAVHLKRLMYAYAKKNYICLAPEFNDRDPLKGLYDLMKWYEIFKSHHRLDSSRLGIVSYSRGSLYAYKLIEQNIPFQAWVNYFGVVYSHMSKSSVIKKNPVPVLILHGKRDRICPIKWAYDLEKAYRAANVPYRIKIFNREGHGFREKAREEAGALTEKFLDQYLKITNLS